MLHRKPIGGKSRRHMCCNSRMGGRTVPRANNHLMVEHTPWATSVPV
jgi:hypothetical protein